MGKIPPSIHSYCLSSPTLTSPCGSVPKLCVVSNRNLACRKITTIGFHAETLGSIVMDIGLSGRGCLGGDRFGLFVSQISNVFLSHYCCSTGRSYETCSQTKKPMYEHNESLKICIPLLDSLIIPKGVLECKASHGFCKILFCFSVSSCIIVMQ